MTNILHSAFIKAEMQIVQKIVDDETWYEGERRKNRVEQNDVSVQRKVADIIIKNSDYIHKQAYELARNTRCVM